MIKQILLLVLTIGLFSTSLECLAQNNVYKYKSDVSKYSIEFPSTFSNLDVTINVLCSKSVGQTYMAYHKELRNQQLIEENNKSKVLLLLLYSSVQDNFGAKVVSQENITVNGYNGKRAIFESGDLSGYTYIFIDLDKGYAYLLIIVEEKNGSFNAENAEKFANTFKILASAEQNKK